MGFDCCCCCCSKTNVGLLQQTNKSFVVILLIDYLYAFSFEWNATFKNLPSIWKISLFFNATHFSNEIPNYVQKKVTSFAILKGTEWPSERLLWCANVIWKSCQIAYKILCRFYLDENCQNIFFDKINHIRIDCCLILMCQQMWVNWPQYNCSAKNVFM